MISKFYNEMRHKVQFFIEFKTLVYCRVGIGGGTNVLKSDLRRTYLEIMADGIVSIAVILLAKVDTVVEVNGVP